MTDRLAKIKTKIENDETVSAYDVCWMVNQLELQEIRLSEMFKLVKKTENYLQEKVDKEGFNWK